MQRCFHGIMFLFFVGLPLAGQTRANNGAPVATDSVGGYSLPVIVKFSGSIIVPLNGYKVYVLGASPSGLTSLPDRLEMRRNFRPGT
jgi:hypothetical protein